MVDKVIEMRNVKKVYGNSKLKVTVLKGIDLDIYKGDFTSIVGTSGSGKSTLMNIIGCLDDATEGKYILNNKDITKYSEKELKVIRNRNIGFIFQSFNLLPKLTAFENVELPLIYRGIKKNERKERVIKALTQVKLENRMKHNPTELSGGQQQRVAIARAIAGEPPILLADEPTGNLDSKSSKETMEILKDLNSKGMTLILITHNNEIADTAGKVITIKDGLII